MSLSPKNKSRNKVLVLKKIDENKKTEIKEQINSLFNDPATFLKLPSESKVNIVVGKKIKGPRFDSHDKLISFSVVGNPLKYLKRRNKSFSVNSDEPMVSNKGNNKEIIYKLGTKDEPEIKIIEITDKEARNIFKTINDNIMGKKKESNNILKNINCKKFKKDIIKMPFINQENSLKNIQKIEKERKLFEDKKNKLLYFNKNVKTANNSLLLKSELYRLKKENINYISSQQKTNIGNGLQKWAFSLRSPKYFKGIRREYVNVGSDKKPVWVKLQEKYPINIENVYNPEWKIEDKYFKTMSNFSVSPKKNNIENIFLKTAPNFCRFKEKTMNLEGLQITGINLFDFEKKNLDNLRGKKKLLQKFIYNKECLKDQNFVEEWNDKKISKLK